MPCFKQAKRRIIDCMERLLDILITHIPDAVRYACKVYRYNVAHYEVDDICHDIIILLIEGDCRRLRTFKEQSSIKTWIYTVARHHVRLRLQRDRRIVSVSFEDITSGLLISSSDPETSIISTEKRKALFHAIAELSKRSQEIFRLSMEGLSDSEISLLVGIRGDAVRKSRYELVNRLKRFIEEQGF